MSYVMETNMDCMGNIDRILKTAAILSPTLGPCGMDKMMVDENGDILVTNDGATILSHLPTLHPAEKLLLNVAQAQDHNVGDGTTSTVLLTASLLQNAQFLLLKGIHSTTIIEEYKKLLLQAKQIIQDIRVELNAKNEDQQRASLLSIAQTTISSKVLGRYGLFFATLAVNAIKCLAIPAFHKIKIITRTGQSMIQSRLLASGMHVILRNRPSMLSEIVTPFTDGTILVANIDLLKGHKSKHVVGHTASIMTATSYSKFLTENAEQERLRVIELCELIISMGVSVVVVASPISPVAERYLEAKKVIPVVVSSIDELEQLALCTACSVASSLSTTTKVGTFKQVDIVSNDLVGLDSLYICGEGNAMCTVELVAPTDGLAEECKRSFVDMLRSLLNAVNEPWIVGGGGSVPIEISVKLAGLGHGDSPYALLCRKSFCDAVMVIPQTLAMNGGLDAVKLVQEAVECHHNHHKWIAIDLDRGEIADMLALNIIEPVANFREGLEAAVGIVELVLKTDKNILATPKAEIS